ncbi:integral membrane protein,Protein of unknown function (DUF975) (plasmid) [[Clostridium] sordellii]|uniref:DUF975 family protein n=1 Tax=Paraclostridium sordellii TaxID=1505 RepID=UPI0005412765|nr:DUF975 family protein [Paeniclostridium sordellii]CEK36592.1 integral membrane protein,Protein of unknown function (DUF975) (plasmid) [[Clostridium] sordellii] [Paeniclostridium sordellii]
MNLSIKELRTISRNQLRGNWKYPILFTLAYFILIMFLNFLQEKYFLIGLLASIISVGISLLVPKFYLEFTKNEGNISLNYLKIPFKKYLNYLLFSLILVVIYFAILTPIIFFMLMSEISLVLLSIITLVISIFFAVFSLALMPVPYLMIETDMKIFELFKVSINMMNGYKWKYFIMMLSFLGWVILSIFTFGIGFLWLYPYVSLTSTNFYNDLKRNVYI